MKVNNLVYAGIVLFNPDEKQLRKNIDTALKQVKKIILVDNGSANVQNVMSMLENEHRIKFICNEKNEGISHALNQIMNWGIENQYEWCMTLDQDSCMTDGMVKKVLEYADAPDIGLLCPVIYDKNKKSDLKSACEEITDIHNSKDVITSGSFTNIAAFQKIGGFDERLFIDYVDFDYNERLLRNGYHIVRVNQAKLIHELGHFEAHHFLFWKVNCTNHNAFRRYYKTRNQLYYKRKYFGYSAYLKEKIKCILAICKCWLYEEDAFNKTKAVIRGMHDFHSFWKNCS